MIRIFSGLAILIFLSFELFGQNRVFEKDLTFDKNSMIKVYYINGELFNGILYTSFDSVINDSSIKTKEEFNVVDGKKEGFYKSVYESGNIEIKCNYRNGKKEGVWKKWFKNGTLKYEGTYKNGQKDGILKSWYSNGNLSFINTYKNGKRHGLCKNYSKTGSGLILCDKNFVNGKQVNKKCYNYE
jgi:antitoxin component YwqK of YwqJK toxin-antitoxin module